MMERACTETACEEPKGHCSHVHCILAAVTGITLAHSAHSMTLVDVLLGGVGPCQETMQMSANEHDTTFETDAVFDYYACIWIVQFVFVR